MNELTYIYILIPILSDLIGLDQLATFQTTVQNLLITQYGTLTPYLYIIEVKFHFSTIAVRFESCGSQSMLQERRIYWS